jgi:uncharacterized membrane protein
MSVSASFLPLLFVMAIVSFACRAGGFLAMRFVPASERLNSALEATPIAVMAGIAVVTAMNGQAADLIALAVVVACMKVTNNDLVAALAGVGTVAAFRLLGA